MSSREAAKPGAKVRLRYTGLVVFSGGLLSFFFGLIFSVIVTRRLSLTEYGIWHTIGALTAYFTWLSVIVEYWLPRHIARGEIDAGKTSLLFLLLIGILSIVAYIPLAYSTAAKLETNVLPFLLFSIYIILMLFDSLLRSIALGYVPHVRGFAEALSSAVKLSLGILLVYYLKLGLIGVIFCVIAMISTELLVYWKYVSQIIWRGKFRWDLVKFWVKYSWLPFLSRVWAPLMRLDVLLITYLLAQPALIASYRAALIYITIVMYSNALAQGLYPILLAKRDVKRVSEALSLVTLFSLPMCALLAACAEHFLALLRIDYVIAANALRIGLIYAVVIALRGVLAYTLEGLETVDIEDRTNLKRYLASNLFYTSISRLVTPLCMLPLLLVSMLLISNPRTVLVAWYFTYSIGALVSFFIMYVKVRKLNVKIVKRNILYQLFSAALMAFPLIYLSQMLPLSERFIIEFMNIVILASVGGATYFTSLYFLDKEFRTLAQRVVKELLNTLKRFSTS